MNARPFDFDMDAILALPPEEQQQALARVALLKAKTEKNRLWLFKPHGGEREFKLSNGIELLGNEGRGQIEYLELNQNGGLHMGAVVAGNRFGKTEIAAVDNLIQILPPEFVPPWLEIYRRRPYVGGYRCRSVVVDLRQLQKVMLPKLRRLCPPDALMDGNFKKAWNDRYSTLTFADGSTWDFLTHDMEVDAFSGTELDRVHFDEEPPGERGKRQFEESLTRLPDRDGDVRFTMTPLLGLSWLFYELSTNGEPRNDEECKVVRGDMEHNPHLDDKARARLVKRWQKEPLKLQARMRGAWVHFEGLIYDEFREAPLESGGHVGVSRAIPRAEGKLESRPSVPIYAAIDPGLDHPAALLFAWLDSSDLLEVFYAEKWQGAIVADVAKYYHGVCEQHNFRPRWTVIDPSARNRNFETGRSVQQVLQEHGIPTLPGQNARVAGFDRVKERLRTQRLVIHNDCEQLIDEFRSYRWRGKRNSQSEDAAPQEPIKINDDLLDCLRYLTMSMPVKAAAERDETTDKSPAQQALEYSMENFRRRKRVQRVGSYVR